MTSALEQGFKKEVKAFNQEAPQTPNVEAKQNWFQARLLPAMKSKLALLMEVGVLETLITSHASERL